MLILIFDVETTGLIPKVRGTYIPPHMFDMYANTRIVQIAWCIYDDETEEQTHINYIINPEGKFMIHNAHIHGITDSVASGGVGIAHALGHFERDMLPCARLVAHNAAFDTNVIRSEMRRANICNEAEKRLAANDIYCTMLTGTSLMPNGRYPTLTRLMEILGIPFEQKYQLHNAASDVYYTVQCYLRLVNKQYAHGNILNSDAPHGNTYSSQ